MYAFVIDVNPEARLLYKIFGIGMDVILLLHWFLVMMKF